MRSEQRLWNLYEIDGRRAADLGSEVETSRAWAFELRWGRSRHGCADTVSLSLSLSPSFVFPNTFLALCALQDIHPMSRFTLSSTVIHAPQAKPLVFIGENPSIVTGPPGDML